MDRCVCEWHRLEEGVEVAADNPMSGVTARSPVEAAGSQSSAPRRAEEGFYFQVTLWNNVHPLNKER